MGLLSKLFGNKSSYKNNQHASTTAVAVRSTAMQTESSFLNIHPDIRDYLWVGDGKYKNYVPTPPKRVSVDGFVITVSFSFDEEPSLIYMSLPIAYTVESVERPPYYPTYKGLSPEQRGVYWKLLANPFDTTIDIGYVFILYYGLERFLLTDKYENVIDLILKLRDVHSNKSFQMYSANAVILTCLQNQRADIVQKFMESLDKNYEYEFSHNLYLLCKYALGLPLTAEDIMRMAKSFEFTKNNYIKKYPELFLENLSANITRDYKANSIPWNKLLSNSEFKKLPKETVSIYANVSIQDNTIDVPSILSSFNLKRIVYNLLDETHEEVKKRLAEMRKKTK